MQLKHNLKVTPETITSNFISNYGFFQKYIRRSKEQEIVEVNMVGLTGTVGSAHS